MMQTLRTVALNRMNNKYRNEKERLINKYNNLVSYKRTPINNIKNISSKQLTEDETDVLNKGLNFNTRHTKKDIITLTATLDNEIEMNLNIPNNVKHEVRDKVVNAISLAKNVPNDNLNS
jgi:hypothetical protein